jgi:hypothetical protein
MLYSNFIAFGTPLKVESGCEEWNACQFWGDARYLEVVFGKNHVLPNYAHSEYYPADYNGPIEFKTAGSDSYPFIEREVDWPQQLHNFWHERNRHYDRIS